MLLQSSTVNDVGFPGLTFLAPRVCIAFDCRLSCTTVSLRSARALIVSRRMLSRRMSPSTGVSVGGTS